MDPPTHQNHQSDVRKDAVAMPCHAAPARTEAVEHSSHNVACSVVVVSSVSRRPGYSTTDGHSPPADRSDRTDADSIVRR